jgi:hypothetical protein
MAAFAGSQVAEAETGGKWRYQGSELSGGLRLQITASGSFSLLMEIIGRTARVTCSAGVALNFELSGAGLFSLGLQLKGTGCKLFLGKLNAKGEVIEEAESKACEPFVGAEKGVVVTDKLKGLLALSTEGVTAAVIEPEVAGKALGTIHMGALCAVGEELPVFGKIYLKDSEPNTELITHTVEAGPLTSLYVINDTAEHLLFKIDGKASASLTGVHSGGKWSGKAN